MWAISSPSVFLFPTQTEIPGFILRKKWLKSVIPINSKNKKFLLPFYLLQNYIVDAEAELYSYTQYRTAHTETHACLKRKVPSILYFKEQPKYIQLQGKIFKFYVLYVGHLYTLFGVRKIILKFWMLALDMCWNTQNKSKELEYPAGAGSVHSFHVHSCVICFKECWLFEDPTSCVEQSLSFSTKKKIFTHVLNFCIIKPPSNPSVCRCLWTEQESF